MLGCQVKTSKGRPCGGAATWTLPIDGKWLLHCDDHAGRHPSGPRHEDPAETPVSLTLLINHCGKYVPDRALVYDFDDCVLPLAETDEDEQALKRYAQLRRQEPSFKSGSYSDNNHDRIIGQFWREREPAPEVSMCEECQKPLDAPPRGPVPRFCSARCRKRASRVA